MLDDTAVEHVAAALLGSTGMERLDLDLDLDLSAAYRIQDEAFCLRLERGETGIGIAASTVDEIVVTSWLTDAMLATTRMVVPGTVAVELELGFVVGRRLAGPVPSVAGVLAAIERVHGVLHARGTGGSGAVGSAAANGATLGFRLSSRSADVTALDLTLEACVMEVDGEVAQAGVGAAMPGRDPAEALAAAVGSFLARGHVLEPGWLVLVGGLTPPVLTVPGSTVAARFTHLGSVGLEVEA